MNDNYNYRHLGSLERKLQLISDGLELELSPEEALIYGIDYADEYPESDTTGKEEDDNQR